MAEINLDIGHALSREDQRQNRRNLSYVAAFFLLCLSPEFARRSSQKKFRFFFLPGFQTEDNEEN